MLPIKSNPEVHAALNESGVTIYTPGGWHVGISKTDADHYDSNFNSTGSGIGGFVENGTNVVLIHGAAKITLTQQETSAIRELIETGRREYWKG